MTAKSEALKLLGTGIGRALGVSEKEALKMANNVAAKEYERAALNSVGGLHPEHPVAIRESLMGLQPTGLDVANLPTGAQLLKNPNLPQIRNAIESNMVNFDKRMVGKDKSGQGWYDLANIEAMKIGEKAGFSNPAKQSDIGAAILAITSPKNVWDANISTGSRAALGLRSGELQKFAEQLADSGAKSFQEARDAGIRIPATASKIFPTQIVKLIKAMDAQGGVGVMNPFDNAIKTDAFYGAIRLPSSIRKMLIKKGVMDKNERILDPDYMINGVRLGDIATMPTIDKFEGAKSLGLSGMGYGLPLKTLDDAKGYRVFSDAMTNAAQRAGVLTPDFQSRGWVAMHNVYPNQNVTGGAGIVQPSIEQSLQAFRDTGNLTPQLLTIINNSLQRGAGLFG